MRLFEPILDEVRQHQNFPALLSIGNGLTVENALEAVV
jgi:hypothetical protein